MKICKMLIKYMTWIIQALQQTLPISFLFHYSAFFFLYLFTYPFIFVAFCVFSLISIIIPYTHKYKQCSVWRFKFFSIFFFFLHVSWGSDPTLVCFCPQLTHKYSKPFPTVAGISSLTQAFLNDIFHFKHLLCPSYASSLPWRSYSHIVTLFPYQSLSTCVIFLSLPHTHLRNIQVPL